MDCTQILKTANFPVTQCAPKALQNLWFELSRATLEKSTFPVSHKEQSSYTPETVTPVSTHLKLAEYATDKESIIKIIA